jgi:hypothetical protein
MSSLLTVWCGRARDVSIEEERAATAAALVAELVATRLLKDVAVKTDSSTQLTK